jgi:hypothetical protein
MIVRKPIMQGRREKQGLVEIVGAETPTHKHISKAEAGIDRPLRGGSIYPRQTPNNAVVMAPRFSGRYFSIVIPFQTAISIRTLYSDAAILSKRR